MKKKYKILLLINRKKKEINKKIISIIKKKIQSVTIKYDDDYTFFKKNVTFDFTISFLSKKILDKKFLSKVKFYNINFHPGPPKYPGIGCYNFALFNSEKVYGVTAHEINEKIDNGKIIKTKYFKINKNCSLKKLIEISYLNLIKILNDILIMILKDKITFSGEKWMRKAYTRNDLDKAAEIKFSYSKNKVYKILRCFYIDGKPSPYIKFKNLKFFYKNH